jgi:predicted DNA-binding protein
MVGEVSLNVRIPAELKKKLDEYCERHGLKQKFVVKEALERYLKEKAAAGP